MTDLTWALSSCVLIGAVAAIRALFGARMRPGLRYALWGLVLLRLLVPAQLFTAPWGVSAELPKQVTERSLYVLPTDSVSLPASVLYDDGPISEELLEIWSDDRARMTDLDSTTLTYTRYAAKWSGADVLRAVWLGGVAVTAAVFLASNLRFYARLRKRRKPLDADGALRVYAVEALSSSCLFGNAVYVAAETARDETRLRHVLAHERSHHRHGDHIWALLRCAALALHWYDPLVWWAAALSRQDSELCADAGALKALGEDEREAYGATLIELSARRAARAPLLRAATTMTNGKKSLRERVTMIARRPRMSVPVVIAVVMIAVFAALCAFAGAETARREFPMGGKNLSDLDTEALLSQIGKAEKVYDPSMLCVNADNYDVTLTPEFDWADDCAIRYFYTKNQKTYAAQLRLNTEENTCFLTESQPCSEQERIYQFKHYLDALKHLPRDEIKSLSPDAERYTVRFTDVGTPKDFDRVICYDPNGAAELDGWLIHLTVLPEHRENGAYHSFGEEVIHLFYGERGSAPQGESPVEAEHGEQLRSLLAQLSPADARLSLYDRDGLQGGAGGASALMAADYLAALSDIAWETAAPMGEDERARDWRIELATPDWRLTSYQDARKLCVEADGGTLWLAARLIPDRQYAWLPYSLLTDWLLDAVTAERCRAEGTPLTREELKAWREALSTMQGDKLNVVSCFFTSTYADPRDLDLAAFLAYCPLGETVSDDWGTIIDDAERAAVTASENYPGDFVPTHRYRASDVNDALMQYAGVTLDELTTDWRRDGRLLYLPEYDAFYNFTSDFGPGVFEARYGERDSDAVTLWSDDAALRLRLTDGGWHILSHLPR